MRDLAGIARDNRDFEYRQAAIDSQRTLAECQDKLRAVRAAVQQEIDNPGSVDWLAVWATLGTDR